MPHRLVFFGSILLALIVFAGLFAPWLAPYSPSEQLDPAAAKLRPPGTEMAAVELDQGWLLVDRAERVAAGLLVERQGKVEVYSASEVRNLTADGVRDKRFFLLGSDKFGRDLLSRLIYGARISLAVGALSVALAMTIGLAIGALAALGGPILDSLLMRLLDGLRILPWFFLLIILLAVFPSGPIVLIAILGGTAWMSISRLVRGEIVSLKQREFVLAARGMGGGSIYIFWRHLLPNVLTPVLVDATLRIGSLILTEAALSFLGFGIAPPTPSWGNMIAEGRYLMSSAWWVATFPGLALVLTVIAINLVGDGLRDALDPYADASP